MPSGGGVGYHYLDLKPPCGSWQVTGLGGTRSIQSPMGLTQGSARVSVSGYNPSSGTRSQMSFSVHADMHLYHPPTVCTVMNSTAASSNGVERRNLNVRVMSPMEYMRCPMDSIMFNYVPRT